MYRAPTLLTFQPSSLNASLVLYECNKAAKGIFKWWWRWWATDSAKIKTQYIGDFSIFDTELFLASGGYLEIPQNMHVETGHLLYFLSLYKASGVKVQYFNDATCHQIHSRDGRPSAPWDWDKIAKSHPGIANFGLMGVNLPECQYSNVIEAGYNPLHPYKLFRHHKLFEIFLETMKISEENSLTDFLGLEIHCGQPLTLQCEQVLEYRRYIGTVVYRPIPIIDESYHTWLALLSSAVECAAIRTGMVIAEVADSSTIWVQRASLAIQRLGQNCSIFRRSDVGPDKFSVPALPAFYLELLKKTPHISFLFVASDTCFEPATNILIEVLSHTSTVYWEPCTIDFLNLLSRMLLKSRCKIEFSSREGQEVVTKFGRIQANQKNRIWAQCSGVHPPG